MLFVDNLIINIPAKKKPWSSISCCLTIVLNNLCLFSRDGSNEQWSGRIRRQACYFTAKPFWKYFVWSWTWTHPKWNRSVWWEVLRFKLRVYAKQCELCAHLFYAKQCDFWSTSKSKLLLDCVYRLPNICPIHNITFKSTISMWKISWRLSCFLSCIG